MDTKKIVILSTIGLGLLAILLLALIKPQPEPSTTLPLELSITVPVVPPEESSSNETRAIDQKKGTGHESRNLRAEELQFLHEHVMEVRALAFTSQPSDPTAILEQFNDLQSCFRELRESNLSQEERDHLGPTLKQAFHDAGIEMMSVVRNQPPGPARAALEEGIAGLLELEL